ncbi:hypothetical protein ACLOJK_030813 [Asimina triloba]
MASSKRTEQLFHEDEQDNERVMSKRAPPTVRAQFNKKVEAIFKKKGQSQRRMNRRTSYKVNLSVDEGIDEFGLGRPVTPLHYESSRSEQRVVPTMEREGSKVGLWMLGIVITLCIGDAQ